MGDVSTQNARGDWVPAIPLPLYEKWPLWPMRYRCTCCGRKLKSEQHYREHYAYAHILGMEPALRSGEERFDAGFGARRSRAERPVSEEDW